MSTFQLSSVAAQLCTTINQLKLLPQQLVSQEDDQTTNNNVLKLLHKGHTHLIYRQLVSALVNELLSKSIPTDNSSGFHKAVVKALSLSGYLPELEDELYFVVDGDVDDDGTSGKSVFDALDEVEGEGREEVGVAARASLLTSLLGEVRTNRLLEHRRYETSSFMREQSSMVMGDGLTGVDASAKATAISYPTAVSKINAAARHSVVSSTSEKTPTKAADSVIALIEKRCEAANASHLLKPLINKSGLHEDSLSKLSAANAILAEEYAMRRRALIQRFHMTLTTFQDADSDTVDKATLRGISALAVARVSEQPQVSLESLFTIPAIELVAAFSKTSEKTVNFSLRNKLIENVPDRGGRVNTFDFDVKVDNAKRRADADLRSKYQSAEEQKNHRQQGGGGNSGGGGRGNKGGGRGGGAGHRDPKSGSGGRGSADGGYKTKDYEAIRGRGGKWSGK